MKYLRIINWKSYFHIRAKNFSGKYFLVTSLLVYYFIAGKLVRFSKFTQKPTPTRATIIHPRTRGNVFKASSYQQFKENIFIPFNFSVIPLPPPPYPAEVKIPTPFVTEFRPLLPSLSLYLSMFLSVQRDSTGFHFEGALNFAMPPTLSLFSIENFVFAFIK